MKDSESGGGPVSKLMSNLTSCDIWLPECIWPNWLLWLQLFESCWLARKGSPFQPDKGAPPRGANLTKGHVGHSCAPLWPLCTVWLPPRLPVFFHIHALDYSKVGTQSSSIFRGSGKKIFLSEKNNMYEGARETEKTIKCNIWDMWVRSLRSLYANFYNFCVSLRSLLNKI